MNNLTESFQLQFKNLIRKHQGQTIISASNVGTIVGLNKYENNRKLFREEVLVSRRFRGKNTTSAACAFGIAKEPEAIQAFKLRHQISETNGFCPPYLFCETPYQNILGNRKLPSNRKISGQFYLGGKGDYCYCNGDNQLFLLEIKCLATRKITKQIPIHYYLQIQTMLYVYHLLKLPVQGAIYCENTFTADGQIDDYWESTVQLDLEYFQKQIIPLLGSYSTISRQRLESTELNQTARPHKRARSETESKLSIQNYYQPKRKFNHALINRIKFNELYQTYLTSPVICGPGGLYNYFNNNHLQDWFRFHHHDKQLTIGPNDVYLPIDNCRKLKLIHSYTWLKILKKHKTIVDLNVLDNQIACTSHVFSPYKLAQTLQAIQQEKDVIIGGQLYHPIKAIWVNFDLLIRNDAFQIDQPHAKHYTPVKLITAKYNRENLSSRYALIDLALEIEVLKFYYGQPSCNSMIFDIQGELHEIGYDSKCKLSSYTKLPQALEWIETVSTHSKQLTIDPPNDNRLYPNSKKVSRDTEFEKFKKELIQKNGELTQLWTVSHLKRNKLVEMGIRSVSELQNHLKNQKKITKLKDILGSSYPNIKNMLLANETQRVICLPALRRQLKSISKTGIEIYLDFEFLPNRIYLIGYRIQSNLRNNSKQKHQNEMKQHLLESNCDKDSQKLADEFHQSIQHLMNRQKQAGDNRYDLSMINCFHWGEVEERLIRQHFGETYSFLNLIDLHEMMVDSHVGIPGCANYSLKNVAKSLKKLDFIQTDWKENINGSWCNQIISNLQSELIRFPDIPEIQQILNYNLTDCEVLVDLVNWIRK